jgi:TatD DNase family protein
MIVGFSKTTNDLAQKLASNYNIFYPTAGLHPDEASDDYLEKLDYLDEFVKTNKIYAIGECGLDYHWEPFDHDTEVKLFEEQIKLAIKYDLPLIVHSRDAAKDTFDIISKYKGLVKGIMHCYSGSLELALEYVKMGWYISLGGPVTFKNAKEPKRVAENIPLDNLLIETDCPYLAPAPFRGKRNESSYVKYTALEIAKIRNMSVDEIEKITFNNALEIFKIKL